MARVQDGSGVAFRSPQGVGSFWEDAALPRKLICGLVLLAAGFFWTHLNWENHDGLSVPDPHSANFMINAFTCSTFLVQAQDALVKSFTGVPLGELPPFHRTQDYPPLVFMLSALVMHFFGVDIQVARMAQVLFVVGLIMVMGRIGWQSAGWRGAILLALGIATSVWTAQFTRIYCMAPGQMFILAVCLTLLLDSQGLTRRNVCLAIGLAFGVGMLIKYSVLLLVLPAVFIFALPRLFGSFHSVLAFLALLFQIAMVVLYTWWGIIWVRVVGGVGLWDPLVLAAEAIFLLGLLMALVLERRFGPSSGVGLLLVSSACGLVCSPWYFANMDLWEPLIALQIRALPINLGTSDGFFGFFKAQDQPLWVTSSFYWGGLAWLAAGTLLLLTWRQKIRVTLPLVAVCVSVLLAHYLLLPADVRYLSTTTPLLVILAFLWAARWRFSFVPCVAFMLGAGLLQVAGWQPSVQDLAGRAGIEVFPLSREFTGPLDDFEPPGFLSDLTQVPVAEFPTFESDFLDEIPPESWTVVVWVDDPPDGSGFIDILLKERACSFRTRHGLQRSIPQIKYLLLCAWKEVPRDLVSSLGLEGKPREMQIRVYRQVLHIEIFRVFSDFDLEALQALMRAQLKN
jgi:hypothetical protein